MSGSLKVGKGVEMVTYEDLYSKIPKIASCIVPIGVLLLNTSNMLKAYYRIIKNIYIFREGEREREERCHNFQVVQCVDRS